MAAALEEILESTSVEGRVQVSAACKAEVERQLRDAPRASCETLAFVKREDAQLQTSKGDARRGQRIRFMHVAFYHHPDRCVGTPCAGAMLIFTVSFQFCQMISVEYTPSPAACS